MVGEIFDTIVLLAIRVSANCIMACEVTCEVQQKPGHRLTELAGNLDVHEDICER